MNNEKIQNLRRIISEALTPLIVGDYVLLPKFKRIMQQE